MTYFFDITYIKNSCFTPYREKKDFDNDAQALDYFRQLIEKYKVDGQTYYLCKWGNV